MPDSRDREIFALAVPALGALAAEPLYILADTAIVGRLGTPQLGGLAIASAALLLGNSIFIFLAYGTTASVSRLLGAGDERRAAVQAVQGLWLAAGIGLVLLVVGQLVAHPIVDVLGADDEVRAFALTYFRISLFGFPFLLITLAGVGYLRGVKDTVRPLVVALVSALVNLVLEIVLIFGFGFGIGASALATVVAQVLAAMLYLRWIGSAVQARGVSIGPEWAIIRSLAVAGFELLIRTTALRLSFLVATGVAARIGTTDLGAHQIVFEIWNFLALLLDALAIAAQSMTGHLLGAGDAEEARAVGRRVIGWSVGLGVVLAIGMIALRPVLPEIFSDDPAVTALAGFLLLHLAAQQPLNGIVFALDGVLIGAGDLGYLAKAMAVAAAVFAASAGAVVWFDLGIGWLWGAIWLLMLTRAVLLVARFRTTAWQKTGA